VCVIYCAKNSITYIFGDVNRAIYTIALRFTADKEKTLDNGQTVNYPEGS